MSSMNPVPIERGQWTTLRPAPGSLAIFTAMRRASLESFLVCFRSHAAPLLGRIVQQAFGFDVFGLSSLLVTHGGFGAAFI